MAWPRACSVARHVTHWRERLTWQRSAAAVRPGRGPGLAVVQHLLVGAEHGHDLRAEVVRDEVPRCSLAVGTTEAPM
eukprot:2750716-Lingulodinium_polyedra.AAC.1